MKAIIVDDESSARNVLERLLQKSDIEIEVVGKFDSLEKAVPSIKTLKPDVVFLDVEMPNYAGYEIASFIPDINFEIIFITAYDQYAIKAFELSAIDYVVKPINRARLAESLVKLVRRIEEKQTFDHYNILLENLSDKEEKKIVISELGNKRIIPLNDIIAIEAQSSYCKLHLVGNNELLVSKNLKHIQNMLPEDSSFFRSHKSWIVSTKHISAHNSKNGSLMVDNRIEVKLSKYRLAEFKEVMAEINK